MTRRSTSPPPGASLVFTALTALTLAPGCKSPDAPGPQTLEPCETPLQVLATMVLQPDDDAPAEAIMTFEIAPESIVSDTANAPLCVVVTSLEAKPGVLASGSFTIDDREIFDRSVFNDTTTTVTAVQQVEPGSHELRAFLTSAPGTAVRVQALLGSAKPLTGDLELSRVVLLPDQETVLPVAGATLAFPPGSVDAPVTVTAFEVSEPYVLGNRIELLPVGLPLNRPVTVELAYDPLRLPPTVTEAELLALNAIQIRQDGEWRPTTVDPENNIASATIEHFAPVQIAARARLRYPGAGGNLWLIPEHNVFVAEIPLGRPGYEVAMRSTPASLPAGGRPPGRNPQELKQVTEHLKGIPGDTIGVNLSKWDPADPDAKTWGLWCRDNHPDCGSDPADHGGKIGIGLSVDTVFSTENSTIDFLRTDSNEYAILIEGTDESGLTARAYFKEEGETLADAMTSMEAIKNKQGGHAVLIGSDTSILKRTTDPDDSCTEPDEDERQTVLGIGEDCTQSADCTPTLLMITTIGDRHSDGHICAVLEEFRAKDAIRLDSGNSASMAYDGRLLNPLSGSKAFSPARFVFNALAVSFHNGPSAPVITSDRWSGANRDVGVHVTAGRAANDGPIKLHCASIGSNYEEAFKSDWIPSGQPVDLTFRWRSPGKKTIYCTTFDENGAASRVIARDIEVAQVDSVTPSLATIGTETAFTISGSNLPSTTVAWIPSCVGPTPGEDTLFTSGDSRQRTFTCTPTGDVGVRTGVVKHDEGGQVLRDDVAVTFVQ